MNQNDRLDTQATDCDDDNSTAQDREIERLLEIIDREIEKPDDEIDCDLIEECTARLDELTPLERPYTDEDIEKNLQKLKDSIRKAETSAKNPSAPVANRWNRPWIKAASAIAACFIVCFSSLSIVAKTQGYDSTWEFVVTNARKIAGMDPGEQTQENTVNIKKPSGSNTYNNIDELLAGEDLRILYPAELPDNVKIESLVYSTEGEDKYCLLFVFTDNSYNFKVYNYYKQNNYENYSQTYESSGIKFYITEKDQTTYHAISHYNGFEYIIQCNNYEHLIYIIDNMKGLSK